MSSGFSTHLGPPEVGIITLPISPLSTDQYLRMIDAGILDGKDNVELIGGLITPMAPAGPEHNGSLIQLTRIFSAGIERYELLIQGTIVIADGNVFDPDLALLRRKPEGYHRALPRPEDVLLVVESASSSLSRDRHVKLPIYAAAGIAEYWIVDLERETLSVFRDPEAGIYRSEARLTKAETVSPLAFPELRILVSTIFG